MPGAAVALVNSAAVPDAEIAAFVAAAPAFLASYLAPFWPETAGMTLQATGPAPGGARLVLAATTTHPGTAGFHDPADGDIVEIDACRQYGMPWTVAAFHELSEGAVNPNLTRFAQIDGRWYPVEIADPCIADTFLIAIGGRRTVAAPNFSTPAYWGIGSGDRYDLMEKIAEPLAVAKKPPPGGWLESSDGGGGAYEGNYGDEVTAMPDLVAYMRARQGRRWRLRRAIPTLLRRGQVVRTKGGKIGRQF